MWFTGLSASGKSTIAIALEQHLLHLGLAAYRLDGDNVRFGLNKDLGFSEKDRGENIRRIAEVYHLNSMRFSLALLSFWLLQVALLFSDSCTITLTSFISPYRSDRALARTLHVSQSIPFIEIYVHVPLSIAESRDPKGLYAKARKGEIKDFTGVSAPYEEPGDAEIVVKTGDTGVEEAVVQILGYLEGTGLLSTRDKT